SNRAPKHLDVHLHIIRKRHWWNSKARTSAFQHNVVPRSDKPRVARIEGVHRDLVRRFSIYRRIVLWCSLVRRRGRFQFCERGEGISQAHISKYLSSDTNIIQPDRDEPRRIKSCSKTSSGFVVKANSSEIN